MDSMDEDRESWNMFHSLIMIGKREEHLRKELLFLKRVIVAVLFVFCTPRLLLLLWTRCHESQGGSSVVLGGEGQPSTQSHPVTLHMALQGHLISLGPSLDLSNFGHPSNPSRQFQDNPKYTKDLSR